LINFLFEIRCKDKNKFSDNPIFYGILNELSSITDFCFMQDIFPVGDNSMFGNSKLSGNFLTFLSIGKQSDYLNFTDGKNPAYIFLYDIIC